MKRIAILVLGTVALSGCSDPMGTSGDPLSREEALAVASNVAHAGGDAFEIGLEAAPGSDGTASIPQTVSAEQKVTQPCPISGVVVVDIRATMQVDDELQSIVIDTDGLLTHNACAFSHGDLTFTLDGNPNIDFSMHAAGVGVEFEPIVSGMDGGFEWSASDGRSGRCGMDFETVFNIAERKRTVRGRICDYTIDQTTSWDPSA